MFESYSSGRKVKARGRPWGQTLNQSVHPTRAAGPSEYGLKFWAITLFITIKTEKGVLEKGYSPGKVAVSLGQTFELRWCYLVSTHRHKVFVTLLRGTSSVETSPDSPNNLS